MASQKKKKPIRKASKAKPDLPPAVAFSPKRGGYTYGDVLNMSGALPEVMSQTRGEALMWLGTLARGLRGGMQDYHKYIDSLEDSQEYDRAFKGATTREERIKVNADFADYVEEVDRIKKTVCDVELRPIPAQWAIVVSSPAFVALIQEHDLIDDADAYEGMLYDHSKRPR